MPYTSHLRVGRFPSLEAFFGAVRDGKRDIPPGGLLLVHPEAAPGLTAARYRELVQRVAALGLHLEFTSRARAVELRVPR